MNQRVRWLVKHKWIVLVGVLAIVLLGAGFAIWRKPASPPAEQISKVITYSTDKPDETKPPRSYIWPGQANEPKMIRIPAIEVEGFIQKVGVDQHKQIAVPDNIHMAGWFVDAVRPGQKGLSIIDGHVDGREQDGIFKHLGTLKQNDEFQVELGNGDIKRYQVMSVTSVATAEAPAVLFSQDPAIPSQLNLITCGGAFDAVARSYEQRIIVTAKLL